MTEKYQLSFSHKYNKLNNNLGFSTVRWPDAVYRLGKTYDVVYIVQNAFHKRIKLGQARIIKLELALLKNLTDQFMQADADTNREGFYNLMQGWYKNKPDWKGADSEVQVLICQWVSKEKSSTVLDAEREATTQTQLTALNNDKATEKVEQ